MTNQLVDPVRLVGDVIPVDDLLEPQSRAPVAEKGLAVADSAVVILLGGASCSPDPVNLLRFWSEQQARIDQHDYPVVAIYVDPLVGLEQSIFEALMLPRLSRASFPFFVSSNPSSSPRAMGIGTPQVVLVESQVITHVIDLPVEIQSLSPSDNAISLTAKL